MNIVRLDFFDATLETFPSSTYKSAYMRVHNTLSFQRISSMECSGQECSFAFDVISTSDSAYHILVVLLKLKESLEEVDFIKDVYILSAS